MLQGVQAYVIALHISMLYLNKAVIHCVLVTASCFANMGEALRDWLGLK